MSDLYAQNQISGQRPVKVSQLCEADAEALDALLAAEQMQANPRSSSNANPSGPMPPGGEARTDRLRRLMRLIDRYDASLSRDESDVRADQDHDTRPSAAHSKQDPPADDPLIQSTLGRVHADRQRQRFARQVDQLTEVRPTLGVSWRQVLTAAAVFVIGMSLLMPVLKKNRADAQRTACASNLHAAGSGFAAFAGEHHGQMPRYERLNAQNGWWRVGAKHEAGKPPQSNSANLYLLVREGYVSPERLNCPANKQAPSKEQLTRSAYDFPNHEAVSYSYQNQFRSEPIRVSEDQDLVILADKNPLFSIDPDHQFAQREGVSRTASSLAHNKRGQNVLKSDSSVQWSVRPMVVRTSGQADNLWTLAGVEDYTGSETPDNHEDNFLVP